MTYAQRIYKIVEEAAEAPARVRDIDEHFGNYTAVYRAIRRMLEKGQLIRTSDGTFYTPTRLVRERPELRGLLEEREAREREDNERRERRAKEAAERSAARAAQTPRVVNEGSKTCNVCAGIPWRRAKPRCKGKCKLPYQEEKTTTEILGASSLAMFG